MTTTTCTYDTRENLARGLQASLNEMVNAAAAKVRAMRRENPGLYKPGDLVIVDTFVFTW